MPRLRDKYQDFLNTHSGKSLLERHRLDEDGIWRILGEDPNCDFGGYHHQPELETVAGKLRDVVAYAVELPGFWQWGAGGDIRKQPQPRAVNEATVQARRADLQRIAHLEEELTALKKRNGL